MADRVPASITIGGTMSAATFAMLSRVIVDEDLSTDWEGARFTGNGGIQLFAVDDDDEVVIGRDTAQGLGYFDAADFLVPPLIVGD